MRPTPVLAALCDDGWPVKPPDAAPFLAGSCAGLPHCRQRLAGHWDMIGRPLDCRQRKAEAKSPSSTWTDLVWV